jgi:hypothetical protein
MALQSLPELAEKTRSLTDTMISTLQKHNIGPDDIEKNGYLDGPDFRDLNAARYALLKIANDLQRAALGDREWIKVTFAVVCMLNPNSYRETDKSVAYLISSGIEQI